MAKNQSIKIVRKFIKALKQEGITVDRVILYGSYARGKTRSDSDIDVAVHFNTPISFITQSLIQTSDAERLTEFLGLSYPDTLPRH